MNDLNTSRANRPRGPWGRIVAAFALALTIAFSAYLLITLSDAKSSALGGIWFLAILPAFLCALICYIGDPQRTRGAAFYWLVPIVLVALVCAGAVWFLKEGVVCLIMLSPIWIVAGWIGAFITRALRKRAPDASTGVRRVNTDVFKSSLLLLPLFSGFAESQIPIAPAQITLSRQIVVQATPAEIWPYTVSNPHIAPTEGRWTFAQNIVGLPRPRATVMHGTGVGAVRTACWGDHISFDEHITAWQPGRKLAWDFAFTNDSLQNYTDKHIAPDGQFLKIASGDYTLTPLSDRTTLVTLNTRYIAKTHVNLYARLWGEVLLGGIESNILTIIKHRAETIAARPDRSQATGR